MLLDLRETVRNSKPIKYTLITIITIPFALVGIGSYLSGGTAATVAEVNGQPINQQQLEQAYQQQRQQLARMFGGQLPEAFANEALLREQAMQQLVSQQVLESEVAKQKFAVGDETLGRAIRNLPAFQVDGRFDSQTYQAQLRASGMSVPAFEQSYRDDTAMNQFRTGISDTSFTLPSEAALLSALARQTRTVEAVRFDFEQAQETIDVTDEEVVAYFDENKDNYLFPRRAKIQYLELNSSELAGQVDVSEDQVQEYYDNNRLLFMRPEQREAAHILLSADEGDEADQINQLNDLKTRVDAGESFADLAKEFSDDVGSAELGGDLGVITSGAMVPEFEEAVFALEGEGALSEPVVTEFGVHLIQLGAVTAESGKPIEEVREEIIETLQQDQADGEFFELREQLTELTFDNPDSLEPASDATGLELKTSDWLDSDTDSGVVLSHPQVQSAMFNDELLEEQINSDLIVVGERHVVVLRTLEHEEQRPKVLDDVRDEVTDALKGDLATQMLTTHQEEALVELAAGESAVKIAEANEMASALSQEVVNRQSTVLDNSVITEIFALAHPGAQVVTGTYSLSNGDLLALRLDAVQVPEATTDEAEDDTPETSSAALSAGANPQLGGTEFEVLLESLRESADVEITDLAGSP